LKRGDIAFVICLFIGVVFGYYIDNFIPGIGAGIGNGVMFKYVIFPDKK